VEITENDFYVHTVRRGVSELQEDSVSWDDAERSIKPSTAKKIKD